MTTQMAPAAEMIPAAALQGGDLVVLKLYDGDELCEIRRTVQPRASRVILIDYRTLSGVTGHLNLLNTDEVLRIQENLARRAA